MIKVLHISFHRGCQNDIEYISKKMGFDLTFMAFHDGISIGNDIYNVTHEKALNSWNLHKDFYNQFDVIITSDTAPISRVFLQNNFQKRLIIWICNRFDYSHRPSNIFPDREYYDLINDAKNRSNVTIINYTPFEYYYATNKRNMTISNECIKPIGKTGDVYSSYTSTIVEDKQNTFIIGPYHNENIMMNLKETLDIIGIKTFNGRYNGPRDLSEFAGVIHIPYAWSNLALFESIQNKIIYFIPSLQFFIQLSKCDNFWFQDSYAFDNIEMSEWYCSENKNVFVFFDSWEDLRNKINTLDVVKQKEILKEIGENHEREMLEKWRKYILPI